MKLSIIEYPKMARKWLLKREHGEYNQHAHFFALKEAKQCRELIDNNKYPREKKYIYPMQRILTKKEFQQLKKKQRYMNVNGGKSY